MSFSPYNLALAALTLLTSLASYIYYRSTLPPLVVRLQILDWEAKFVPSFHRTFTLTRNISAWGTGPEQTVTSYIPLSSAECETKLHKDEKTCVVDRKGNSIVRLETNTINANVVNEDELTMDWFTRSDLPSLHKQDAEKGYWPIWGNIRSKLLPSSGDSKNTSISFSSSSATSSIMTIEEGNGTQDMVMLSILDGHGGGQTSALLKRVLNGTLAYAIARLEKWSSKDMYQTIIQTFIDLDRSITSLPLSIIHGPFSSSLPHSPHLPTPNPALLASVPIAGACACTALIDVQSELLYIANLGDCRAVAGWYNPQKGGWRTDTLSQDHGSDNPHEVERLKAKHPTEQDTVIVNEGFTPRVKGNCQPTRAFGDDNLKTAKQERDLIERACQFEYSENRSRITGELFPQENPPYIEAEPEVVIRKLRSDADGEELKFLVVATDGLWDTLSSEEVVLLLASHLSHAQHAPIPKSVLPAQFPQASPKPVAERPFPAEPMPGTTPENSRGTWVFEDYNAATHLIRNGMEGNGDKGVRELVLSLPGGDARKVRDDTTVAVIFFDTARLDDKA